MRIISSKFTLSNSLGALTLAILGVYGFIWLWHLQSVSLVIPMDNVEEMVWVRSLELGYYKHPPLPTWLLWPFVRWFGLNGQVTMYLGGALTLASIGLMVTVARRAGGQAFGLIALLAALCVTFYNGRLYYYNHNVVLMLWVALSAFVFLQIMTRPQPGWWIALGVVGGLAMLSKYQFALMVMPMTILCWQQRMWRSTSHLLGLAIATLVAMSLFAPHLWWLLHQARGPIDYAVSSSLGDHMGGLQRVGYTLNWTADWLFNRCLPALLVLLLCAWGLRAYRTGESQASAGNDEARAARMIVLLWGFAPLALMVILGLASGTPLQAHWGTAFAVWTVPALMLLLRLDTVAAPDASLWRWLVLPFAVIQGLLLMVSYETSAYGHFAESSRTWRQFPAKDIAASLESSVRSELGRPIDVIVGSETISGAIALELPGKPKVLIDGDLAISPWISPQEMKAATKIWIWREDNAPAGAHSLPHGLKWSS